MNNIVLRGCSLRNTDILYGLVLYTGINICIIYKGKETKVMMNSFKARAKKSSVETEMNI